MITAPGSGHGKTTVATGIMGALRSEGLEVAPFKVGPDYIDPGYHSLATGRPGRNLDPHLCSPGQLAPLLRHGSAGTDVAVIEGVMGLFDGQLGGDGFASTAHVAGLVGAPLILVLDISSVSRTAAALVHGLNTFEPGVRLSGVILNKAGSSRHATEIIHAMEATGLEVLGVLPRDAGIEAPSRHLGLVPAAERAEAAASVARLSDQVREHLSLTTIMQIAHGAPDLVGPAWDPYAVVQPPSAERPVVAIAAGRAFTFRYAETEELLRAAGCEPVVFDPLTDPALPAGTAGLYLGGGFPEVHAAELSANTALRTELRTAIAGGLPTVAECAGLLYLCRQVDGAPMVGAVEADAVMTSRLTLGYRTPVAGEDLLLAPAGTRVTGHEFHRTTVDPVHGHGAAWLVDGHPVGFSADPAGTGGPTLHASYLHLHWAGHPQLAQRFADAVHAYAPQTPARPETTPVVGLTPVELATEPDLHHHGDRDIAESLVDLAVNVRLATPPDWLQTVINATTADLAAYPRPEEATLAIAAAHGLAAEQVLPTAGGAEAFTLLARGLHPRHPVVVHPQFTEPEAALLAAGHRPTRVLLSAEHGFTLDPALIPADADLVVIGNPTNPTGVLHPAELIRSLLGPGRVVVVDEAFMDAVPGESQSVITPELTGLLVLRSLTKTWGLAGLRAGYAVGDPALITALRAQQPPWSVSTPALSAMVACLTEDARRSADAAADDIAERRQQLVRLLHQRNLAVAADPQAPFVLVDTAALRGSNPPGSVRLGLRDRGFAVRRGDTFPGLGPDWIRIAVRDEDTHHRLAAAFDDLAGETGSSARRQPPE